MLACDDGFEYACGAVRLGRGDSIVVCTDGVTEAMDEQRRQFGSAGMLEALQACGAAAGPEQVTERVMERVRAHAGRAPQSDDIAILAIQYFGPNGRADG